MFAKHANSVRNRVISLRPRHRPSRPSPSTLYKPFALCLGHPAGGSPACSHPSGGSDLPTLFAAKAATTCLLLAPPTSSILDYTALPQGMRRLLPYLHASQFSAFFRAPTPLWDPSFSPSWLGGTRHPPGGKIQDKSPKSGQALTLDSSRGSPMVNRRSAGLEQVLVRK